MKTVAAFVVNPIRSPYKNDQYDSFRTEGRAPINIGFGLSLMGFEVNLIMGEWDIKDKKEVWKNVYLSNMPIHRHYDYILTWNLTSAPMHGITFDKMIFMDWNLTYIDCVRVMKKDNNKIIYTVNNKPLYEYLKLKNLTYGVEIEYLPGLYPIPSVNIGFLPYNFDLNKLKNEIILYMYYNLIRNSGTFFKKQQFIIDFFRNKNYNVKLIIHTSNSTKNPFSNVSDVTYLYDEHARYIDILNTINSCDICITSGSSSTASSLQESVSLGKPMLFIGDNKISKDESFINSIYYCSDYLIYNMETDEESKRKLENFILNPKESYDKFKDAFEDLDFNNWKNIALKYFIP